MAEERCYLCPGTRPHWVNEHSDAFLPEHPPAPLTTAPCCTSASCAIPGPYGHVVVGAAPVCALCHHALHDGKRCGVDGCECSPGETIYESPPPNETCPEGALPPDLDPEVVPLVVAMNGCVGIKTTSSCCGHGESPIRVAFEATDLDVLLPLVYLACPFHVNHRWRVLVFGDPTRRPYFVLESTARGSEAYGVARELAGDLQGWGSACAPGGEGR